MPNELAIPSMMSREEFVRICHRIFGPKWKRPAAKALSRELNTIHCYASGRKRVMGPVAVDVWEWEQMINDVERLVTERGGYLVEPAGFSADILECRRFKGIPDQYAVRGLWAVRIFLQAFAQERETADA